MICLADWWTWTPSATPLQPKKWNAQFSITFNFWWSARLVDGLKPHLPPLSSQKNEMLILDYVQLLMISQAGQWTQTPSATPLQPKNEMLFLDYVQLLMIAWTGQWTRTPSPAMLIFGLPFWPGWLMDSNSSQKMKSSFLYYVELLMISRAGQWTRTPSATLLQPKKWNAHFWITFNFWWLARLVDGLKLHPPPVCSQKNEILIFVLRWTSDDQPGWLMDSNPICHPSPAKKMKCSFLDFVQLLMIGRASWGTQTPFATPLHPKKWNAHFWITFNFWWLARLVNGLKPHPPLLSSQKEWNAHFWITFPSDDLPGWLMNLNLICHPSPTKKMKCSLFDYVQLLMISQAGQLTQSPSASPLQPIKWNASFWIMFTSDDQPGWLMDSNPICHPSPAKKMKCSFLDYIQLLMIGRAGQWTQTPSATPLQPKNEMLLFGLRSTSDDRLDWSMDSNPILHLSPAKEMKCSFLYYVQLLMIGWAGWWTRTPSTTPLQPKKWDAHFCITFNIWCWPDWSMDLNLIQHSSPSKNMKWSFLGYIQLLMISRAVRWTQTPSATPLQPIKWNASFWITFTSDDLPGWLMNLKPHLPPLSYQKMKCSIFDYVQLLMIGWAGKWTQTPSFTPLLPKNEMLIFWLCSTSDVGQTGQWTQTPSTTPSPAK